MISREEAISMAKKAWDDSGEGWVTPYWFKDRGAGFELMANRAYAKGLEDAVKVCHPNFIGEHPVGSGKEDRFDLGRLYCVEQIQKLKEQP